MPFLSTLMEAIVVKKELGAELEVDQILGGANIWQVLVSGRSGSDAGTSKISNSAFSAMKQRYLLY